MSTNPRPLIDPERAEQFGRDMTRLQESMKRNAQEMGREMGAALRRMAKTLERLAWRDV